MRYFVFLLGLGALLVGVSSYFDGIPLPIDFGSKTVSIGVAEYKLDVTLIVLGILFMLLSNLIRKAKW
jgi:hypothetical protein